MVGETVFDLAAQLDSSKVASGINTVSLLAVLQNWELLKPVLDDVEASPVGPATPIGETELAAPILYPGVFYMAGANYIDHVMEMTGKPPADKSTCEPFFFLKTTGGTIIGSEENIVLPDHSAQVDWEAEIAIVIGRSAKNVSVDRAMDFVAGYTIVNDLSARDNMIRDDVPFKFDWLGQKCFDTAAPMGPWVTPADQIGDANSLTVKLWVNETLHQDSNTDQLIFNYAELIAYLSERVTLQPGDVISTGTPAGVGHGKGVYLQDGDVVKIEIENVGVLSNPVTTA